MEQIPLYKIQQPGEAAFVEPGNQYFSETGQQNYGSKDSEIIFLYSYSREIRQRSFRKIVGRKPGEKLARNFRGEYLEQNNTS